MRHMGVNLGTHDFMLENGGNGLGDRFVVGILGIREIHIQLTAHCA